MMVYLVICQSLTQEAQHFKKFFIVADETHGGNIQIMSFVSGYVRTTDALTGIRFRMSSGNLDSGSFQLFGVHR